MNQRLLRLFLAFFAVALGGGLIEYLLSILLPQQITLRHILMTVLAIIALGVISVRLNDANENDPNKNSQGQRKRARMNLREITVFIPYLILMAAIAYFIWQFGILPKIRMAEDNALLGIERTETPRAEELVLANMQIYVSPDGTVTLRTTVNSLSEGVRRPIKTLNVNNFKILEQHNSQSRPATIIDTSAHGTPIRIIVLIDMSSSMMEPTEIVDALGNQQSKIEVVRSAVEIFANGLIDSNVASIDGKPSYLAFLAFSSERSVFLERSNGDIWFPTLPESREDFRNALSQLMAGGQTPLYNTISQAINVLQAFDDGRYKLILCLSDGMDNDSELTEEQLLLRLQDNNIPVVVVGYGVGEQFASTSLNKIATNSGAGSTNVGFFDNVAPSTLLTLFEGLLNDLNNIYELRWMSSFPQPGNLVHATISVNYKAINGDSLTAQEFRRYSIPAAQE